MNSPAQAAFEAHRTFAPDDREWEELEPAQQQPWWAVASAAIVAEALAQGGCNAAPYILGDYVRKRRGDYVYEGWVVGVIHKRSGQLRLVVEDARGMLMILHPDAVEGGRSFGPW